MSNSGYKILKPGDQIGGRYQIIQHLGGGGFSVTYLAQDLNLPHQAHCVVKQLRPMFPEPWIMEDARKRFAQEANVQQRRLGIHPQIPELLAHFEGENQELYLVQEFIEGEILETELSNRQFNETEVITLLDDVLKILDFVHQNGVIHRDIKPSNLIRRRTDGKMVLIDFGAVKELGSLTVDTEGNTTYTRAIGTPGYMPPEQYMGRPNPVYASDIYALGKTAIYALTKKDPVDLEDTLTGELKNWQDYIPENVEVSNKLVSILNKMVRFNSLERYQLAQEVLDDLAPLFKVGKTIGGGYKIISYLGGGIWGHTYLAENLRRHYQSPCVIKQLKPQTNDGVTRQEVERRFSTEINVLQKLGDHNQIPKLWDHFSENQEFYLVQEFIDGQDLSKELAGGKRLSEASVINLLKQVLTVLIFIHKNGIIHRDIKPSNLIRRTGDSQILLIDFGIVKEIVTVSENAKKTKNSTQPVGTEGYMPPEQMVGRPTYASDIYALGITAIQALTGLEPEKLPINPHSAEVKLEQGINVSDGLAHVLNKMVSVDLARRYDSAEKVLVAVEKIAPKKRQKSAHDWVKYIVMLVLALVMLIASVPLFFAWQKARNVRQIFDTGNSYYNQGNFNEALKFYDNVLSIDANFHEAWTNKGYAHSALGEYDEMRQACKTATTIAPKSSYAWNCQGEADKSFHQFDEAIAAFDQAIELNGEDPAFWINRGEALLKKNEPLPALEDINQAIELLASGNNPKELSVAWSYKGWALRDLEKFLEALEAYNKSLQFAPDYFPAKLGQGISLRGIEQYKLAKAIFEEILENTLLTKTEKVETWFWYGLTLCDLGSQTEAINAFNQVLTIDPNHQPSLDAQNNCLNLK
ncbi:MAG: protein kinase [Gomphosphaeria aponina SAG 52.96 = DSM 107014]|uniref:non-specific serine/threonine protein kinase n=1 Tax=Gomphosphaeria aponina SAG 52.96 = DSM 107014 TaxID=1521640 RepID=A0A941JUX8_9CHRO|nr:protein kinase [Gomphosphaeria aponina SAG 52.96 = DSM 107014]